MCNLKTSLLLHVFILTCFGKQHVYEHAHSNIARVPTRFSTFTFQCISGQRIDGSKECDGKADCLDASDETVQCRKIQCLPLWFVCDYGACIDKILECDRKIDCADGSDEKPDLCQKNQNCKLPQHPKNGNFSIFSDTKTFKDFVSQGTIMQIDCDEGYKLEGVSALLCENGQWSSEVGRCLKTCSPRVSTEAMKVTCVYKNKESENCTNAIDGTLAKFECSPNYEDPELVKRAVHICKNGTWDLVEPNCVKVKLED